MFYSCHSASAASLSLFIKIIRTSSSYLFTILCRLEFAQDCMQLRYLRAQSHLILSFLYIKGLSKGEVIYISIYFLLICKYHYIHLNAFSSVHGAEPRGRRTDWGHFYLCRAGAGAGERRERWVGRGGSRKCSLAETTRDGDHVTP